MGQQNNKTQKQQELDFQSEFLQDNSNMKMEQKMQQAYRISKLDRKQQMIKTIEKQKYEDQESIMFTEADFKLNKGQNYKQFLEENEMLTGILEKQSPNLLGTWDERYCTLTNLTFIYHQKKLKESPEAGILNFNLLSCYVIIEQKNSTILSFKIRIHESEKQFVFKGKNQLATRQWAVKLKQITDKSVGRQLKLSYLAHYNRFWRKNYLSQKDFREQSQAGDLILMRGNKNSAVFQRAITQQQYDHVAVVLKNVRNDVLLFEASGVSGVGIIPWHKFIHKKWYKDQDIVAWRKLNLKRTKQFYDEIEDFVQRNMGRKYKFSVNKYIANRESTSEDKQTYFCSSLVGKLYKKLELLDSKKSSTQYLPSSFSQKYLLGLRKDGKYGHTFLQKQKIIVFEKQFFEEKH